MQEAEAMTPTLQERIAELRRLREAATQEEWFGDPAGYCEFIFAKHSDPRIIFSIRGDGSGEPKEANRDFVVYAANNALSIIDELQREMGEVVVMLRQTLTCSGHTSTPNCPAHELLAKHKATGNPTV